MGYHIRGSLGWAGLALVFVAAGCQAPRTDNQPVELTASTHDETAAWDVVRAQTNSLARITLVTEPVPSGSPDIVSLKPGRPGEGSPPRPDLRDLGSLLSPTTLAGFAPAALPKRGLLHTLPSSFSMTQLVYANPKVLADLGLKPALTYADLRAQVPKLRAAGRMVLLMANKEDWVMASGLFSTVVGRLAGEGFARQVANGEARFTDPGFVNALRFVQTLYADGVLAKSSLLTGYGEVAGLFSSGAAAYLIDGDWRAMSVSPDTLVTLFPTLPDEPEGSPGTAVIVGPGYGISAAVPAGSARESAALAVLLALESPQVQALRLVNDPTLLPSRWDVALPAEGALFAALGELRRTTATSDSLETVFEGAVMTTLQGGLRKIALGIQTPEEVAAEVQATWDDSHPAIRN